MGRTVLIWPYCASLSLHLPPCLLWVGELLRPRGVLTCCSALLLLLVLCTVGTCSLRAAWLLCLHASTVHASLQSHAHLPIPHFCCPGGLWLPHGAPHKEVTMSPCFSRCALRFPQNTLWSFHSCSSLICVLLQAQQLCLVEHKQWKSCKSEVLFSWQSMGKPCI